MFKKTWHLFPQPGLDRSKRSFSFIIVIQKKKKKRPMLNLFVSSIGRSRASQLVRNSCILAMCASVSTDGAVLLAEFPTQHQDGSVSLYKINKLKKNPEERLKHNDKHQSDVSHVGKRSAKSSLLSSPACCLANECYWPISKQTYLRPPSSLMFLVLKLV